VKVLEPTMIHLNMWKYWVRITSVLVSFVSMQNVVCTGDGGTSSSTLHNATFVSDPGNTIGSETMLSLDLNVTGCNDRDSLSNVNIGSDHLTTSKSLL
jgi:hypothetical protein